VSLASTRLSCKFASARYRGIAEAIVRTHHQELLDVT
jgi:hypothetical protein